VGIEIAFYGSDRTFVNRPHIAFAYVARNTVFYAVFDIENDRILTIFEEPYDKAYKIVYGRDRVMRICEP
jgi:hypothetical protein